MPRRAVASGTEEYEPDRRRELGFFYGVRKTADRRRHADACGHAEEFGGRLFDAEEVGAAARNDDLREHHVARNAFGDLRFSHAENLEDARSDDRP